MSNFSFRSEGPPATQTMSTLFILGLTDPNNGRVTYLRHRYDHIGTSGVATLVYSFNEKDHTLNWDAEEAALKGAKEAWSKVKRTHGHLRPEIIEMTHTAGFKSITTRYLYDKDKDLFIGPYVNGTLQTPVKE